MLCGQRAFFLDSTQYESVILEFVNTRNGVVTYRFSKIEDVDDFAIYTRKSLDGAQTWQEWERQEIHITGNPATFSIQFTQGVICEAYVIVIGDGTREQSDPSNILTTIVPREPALSPPIIEAHPFYYDGRPYPFIYNTYMPTGVSKWATWQRKLADADWHQIGVASGNYTIFDIQTIETEVPYQFRTAWASNDGQYLLSDLSNVANITLPSANIDYLLPPIRLLGEYLIWEGDGNYWFRLTVGRGDMRSNDIAIQYKSPTMSNWEYLSESIAIGNSETAYWRWVGIRESASIVTGEVWRFRLKNVTSGYLPSDWSEVFEVTIPSMLPRLDTPSIRFNQIGSNVVISWDSVDDAVGYKLERKLMEETDFTLISDSIPSSWTSYEDTTTQTGNTYVYRLTARGDNVIYQNSLPAEDYITVSSSVVLQPPVLSNLAASGIDITMTVSNLDGANSRTTYIEMSEDNGAWQQVGFVNVESVAVTSVNTTIVGEKILNGGVLRFRAYQSGMGIYDDSDYSEIVSITIDHREWLLRWNGTSWDDPSGTTGGWMNQTTTDSEGTHVSNITESSPSVGVKRLQGTGYYRTVNALTENKAALTTKYKRVWVIGTLSKDYDGENYYAMVGNMFTYPFSGGTNVDFLHWVVVSAGYQSHPYPHGEVENPNFVPNARNQYGTTGQGPYLFFHFNGGHADVRGILGIKQQ